LIGKSSSVDYGEVEWSEGDLFVMPASDKPILHQSTSDTAIYWITDSPLLAYLGVEPVEKKFNLTLFKKERMLAEVEAISHQPGAEHRNRMGILLGEYTTTFRILIPTLS
jgi:hypothetical protein